jgi:DNA-binding NarL/FixJ family response regulator
MFDEPTQSEVRVVISDDSVEVRRRLVSMMSDFPYVNIVDEADGAYATIKAIESSQPDVVVLDIQMPDGSGIEVLKRIKNAYPSIRVIMLTNHANSFYRNACMKAGADYFLDKSLDFRQVGEILGSLNARLH